jgi:ClpX C4-type zinc finger
VLWRRSAPKPRCSFCNRTENEAKELIPSPINDWLLPPPDHFVYICADCIAVCNQLLKDMREDSEGREMRDDLEGTIQPS